MSKIVNALVVGSNRGLGLQLVKDLVTELRAERVFATYRSADQSKELFALAATNPKVVPLQLDSRDEKKFPEVVKLIDEKTGGAGLNLLINNAGIFNDKPQDLNSITKESMLLHFEVNTVAPFLLSKAFIPLLEKASAANSAAAIVNMSSILGSVELTTAGDCYSYRASKAALNMVNRSLSAELGPKNIISVVLHPGWVKTDMGGENAQLTISESVAGMIKVIAGLKKSDSGEFLQYDGKRLPW